MLDSGAVQQLLIIRITQGAVPKQIRERVIESDGLSAVVFAPYCRAARRQPERAPQQICELTGENACAPVLLFRHFGRVAYQVRQALLLRHASQLHRIVTSSPVADHYTGEIGRD
jgi:hypothetical protein